MRRSLFIFLLASFLLTVLVYRGALVGTALLAPLDQGPTFFENFEYANPSAGRVPHNHYISDQFAYDLPLQAAIHKAYRDGEIPWWDPWTYGGRPLLADAHVNGTDPIRVLCNLLLPFELAYNWNIALRGILTGLGMFLLLRFLKVGSAVSTLIALSYQFAGWFTLFFGHPWIQGSFAYYPFLWIVWAAALGKRPGRHDALAAILVACIFASGNLQSHTYLPLFAFAFLLGSFFGDRARFARAFSVVAISGLLGALLTFPLLGNQLEFFLNSSRSITGDSRGILGLLAVPFSMISIHPWAAGTFRSLELGKLFGQGGIAFLLFFGGAGTVIAVAGLRRLFSSSESDRSFVFTSMACVVIYLIVIASPLNKILYPRMAGMAGMGLVVLTALACREWALKGPLLSMKWARRWTLIHLTWVVTASGVLLVAYPHAKNRITAKVFAAGVKNSGGLGTEELRLAQIERLPQESSLLNPEASIGLLATLLALFAMGRPLTDSSARRYCSASLFLGLVSCVAFHHRFRPMHDVAIWEKLREGGPAQRSAMQLTEGGKRIDESMLPLEDQVFPFAWAAFYRVHAVQGYSALQPNSFQTYPANQPPLADTWRADFTGDGKGGFIPSSGNGGPARFRDVRNGEGFPLEISGDSHNRMDLIYKGAASATGFIQTDTRYPGWHLSPQGSSPRSEGFAFSRWKLPMVSGDGLALVYEPSLRKYWSTALSIALIALTALIIPRTAGTTGQCQKE